MIAKIVRQWLTQLGAKRLYIEPGSTDRRFMPAFCQPDLEQDGHHPGSGEGEN